MSDLELRALVQRAEASDDGALWLRAGRALARSGRHEEAGQACLRARVASAPPRDVGALEDELVPDLDAFSVRELGRRAGLGRLTLPLLHGERLLVVERGRTLIEWDLATDVRRTIQRFGGAPVDALARCARTGRQAVAYGLRLVLVDAATGEEDLVARGVGQVTALALQGEVVTWIEGYDSVTRLDMARHSGVDEAWGVRVPLSALDRSGALAIGTRIGGHQVHIELYAAGSETRRTSFETAIHATALDAVGDRAVVCDAALRTLFLVADGEVLARASYGTEGRLENYVPSPSGRQALIAMREPGGAVISLLDLRTGASRVLLRERIYGAAWSASGRRLALTDDYGKVILLEAAASAPDERREEAPSDEEWVRLRTAERFWLARRVGSNVEVRQGRHGSDGQTSTRRCRDEPAAARELAKKVREKRTAGYRDG